MPTHKNDPKFVKAYERGMLRSAFVSLFWGIATERKKTGDFTFKWLAETLGKNKGEVSRWFSGDPNWTVNTIANLADAFDVEIQITAIERKTGRIFTSSGLQNSVATKIVASGSPNLADLHGFESFVKYTSVPQSFRPLQNQISAAAA